MAQKTKNTRPSTHPVIARLLLLVSLAVSSGILGAFTAIALSTLPLSRNSASSHSSDRVTSMIPGQLTRPLTILVLGIDNSGHPHTDQFSRAEALAGNSDTMLLVRLEPQTHHLTVLSIPRDTLVNIPGIGIDKINAANVQGGAAFAEKMVSQLLNNVPVDRYIRLDTEGLIHLVDALGGVNITVPKPMDYVDRTQNLRIHFIAGHQKLNGKHLQEYVRFRHDELGDIGRVQRQQDVLRALLQQSIQPTTLTKLPKIVNVIQEDVDTDLSLEEMLAVTGELSQTNRSKTDLVMLPGRFSREDEYPLSYWISDPDAIEKIAGRYFAAGAMVR